MVFSAYINSESKSNSDVPSDIDNMRDKYVDIDESSNISVIFPGFEISVLEKWMFILLTNSKLVDWKNEWLYRPDYVSCEHYNTPIYWYIILYVNQIDSLEDFTFREKIIIPQLITIKQMVSDIIVNTYENSKSTSTYPSSMFYKRYPLDDMELTTIASKEELIDTTPVVEECELYENIEEFTLTSTDISNMYVDLEYSPANYSSIEFQIDGYTTVCSYGYDYILKYVDETSNLIRISWSKEDCTYGNGLENILEENDKIIITYLYLETGCDPCSPCGSDVLDGGVYE